MYVILSWLSQNGAKNVALWSESLDGDIPKQFKTIKEAKKVIKEMGHPRFSYLIIKLEEEGIFFFTS